MGTDSSRSCAAHLMPSFLYCTRFFQMAAGKFLVKPYWGLDLGSEHERYITERVRLGRPTWCFLVFYPLFYACSRATLVPSMRSCLAAFALNLRSTVKQCVAIILPLSSTCLLRTCMQVFKKPVIIINYPKEIKAFYMKVNPDGKVRSRRCT